jgi:2-polyprenyl-6-methoxyphenol hydroxylase-like FAD-dependent oxidoreductase
MRGARWTPRTPRTLDAQNVNGARSSARTTGTPSRRKDATRWRPSYHCAAGYQDRGKAHDVAIVGNAAHVTRVVLAWHNGEGANGEGNEGEGASADSLPVCAGVVREVGQ